MVPRHLFRQVEASTLADEARALEARADAAAAAEVAAADEAARGRAAIESGQGELLFSLNAHLAQLVSDAGRLMLGLIAPALKDIGDAPDTHKLARVCVAIGADFCCYCAFWSTRSSLSAYGATNTTHHHWNGGEDPNLSWRASRGAWVFRYGGGVVQEESIALADAVPGRCDATSDLERERVRFHRQGLRVMASSSAAMTVVTPGAAPGSPPPPRRGATVRAKRLDALPDDDGGDGAPPGGSSSHAGGADGGGGDDGVASDDEDAATVAAVRRGVAFLHARSWRRWRAERRRRNACLDARLMSETMMNTACSELVKLACTDPCEQFHATSGDSCCRRSVWRGTAGGGYGAGVSWLTSSGIDLS